MQEENKNSASSGIKSAIAQREEEVLKFWKENKIFEKSLEKKSPKGEYVFYEGPPTANGKPGIHHLEARAFKDAIPRYKTMCGYHVRRKGGWDTHGLPVELQVEKKLGLDSKKAIEEYGISKFNKECKESVWEYTDLWTKFTDRIGYWVDQKDPYVTYHNDYIESVWRVVKEANNQKLLFKDYKVVPWCPRCGTALSSHELAQGYQDVKDLSVYVKFKIKNSAAVQPQNGFGGCTAEDNLNTYILAWTTTPWTLPGNVALAIGEKMIYVKIKKENEFLILAKERLLVIDGEYEIVEEMKGLDLVGLEYEPLYPYLTNIIFDTEKPKLEKAFKVYEADFVTTEDGTGVVHTAVMYGQDDFELGTKIGLPKYHLVGLDGKFVSGTGFLEGKFVRDEETAVEVIKDLAHRGLLFKKEKYEHSYPHCWRCKTALIYYARDSWYIRMSELRDKMVKENAGINWEPSYIKEGRFGEWLKDIKDWAISRERYWGTPLPVWNCDKCKKIETIGSLDDIRLKTKKSGNKYFVIRHGEAENNTLEILNSSNNTIYHLTEKGKDQVKNSAKELKDIKFDYVFSSPIQRAVETANILKNEIGLSFDPIIDERIREIGSGDFEGKPVKEYYEVLPPEIEQFSKNYFNNESNNDVKRRVGSFLYELESKYENKNILIVSHACSIWMMHSVASLMNPEESIKFSENNFPKNAEVKELKIDLLPHNENYELDLHKPYIDEINLSCECGGRLERTKEVMDVWLDSGCMPFAQDHYPFEKNDIKYPADFICEAIDQTRGWFYTLHAVGSIMGKGKAYKNVICLGHILDSKGKKMSKSLGNIIDPWVMMDKYGVDTLRLWMYSVNQPGESKNFDEKTVSELNSKIFNLIYNVITFYELYRDKSLENNEYKGSDNILDKWIVSRLSELVSNTTKQLDEYKLLEPIRALRLFIEDLSTWYLRRSRERIKDGDVYAKKTLYYVLKNLVKMMAPFTPFASEDIWQKLKNENDEESIHLVEWPSISNLDNKIIGEMKEVREVVTLGLQARQKLAIPVRQPLNSIKILSDDFSDSYIEILKDELNIKNILFTKEGDQKVELDINITEDLKKEGIYRELIRAIQDIRKKDGLNPNDIIILEIFSSKDGEEILNKFRNEMMKTIVAKDIQLKDNEGVKITVSDIEFKVNLIK